MEEQRRNHLFPGSKLFYQIFSIFVALMLVLTLVLGYYLSGVITQNRSEKMHQANLSLLSQVSDSVNLTFAMMEENMAQFLWSSELISSSVNPTRVDATRDTTILFRLRSEKYGNDLVANAFFYNVYTGKLYNSDSDIIDVKESSLWSVMEQYFNMDLSEIEISSLSTRNVVAFIDQKLYLFVDLFLRRPYSTLVYEISLDNFQELVGRNIGEGDCIEVYDERKNEIFSTLYPYSLKAEELEEKDIFIENSEISFSGQKYYRVNSQENGWSYILPISDNFISVSWQSVLPIVLPILLLVFAISIFCTWLISVRLYRPIGQLVSSFMSNSKGNKEPFDRRRGSEIEYLQKTYGEAIHKVDRMEGVFSSFSEHLLAELLHGVLEGKLLETEQEEMLKMLGAPIQVRARYLVLLGKAVIPEDRLSPQLENNLYIINIYNMIREMECDPISLIPLYWEKDQIVVVISAYLDIAAKEMKEYTLRIQSDLENYTKSLPYQMVWGVGKIYEHINDLRYSYREAKEQLGYCLYHGTTRDAISVQNMLSEENYAFYLNERVKQLWKDGFWGDRKEGEELIRRLLLDVKNKSESIEAAGKLYEGILDTMTEKLISMHARKEELDARFTTESINSIKTLDELFEKAETCAMRLVHMLYQYGRKARYVYVDEAKAYIAAHYTDSGLTQNEVSEHIGITVSYLSERFKEVTGQSFPTYLNTYRVEKAKQMLQTTGLSIQEVGYLCGFNSAQSFIRVFKKYVLMTPGQYRNQK